MTTEQQYLEQFDRMNYASGLMLIPVTVISKAADGRVIDSTLSLKLVALTEEQRMALAERLQIDYEPLGI